MITDSSYAEGLMGTWRRPPTPRAMGCVTASAEEAAGRAESGSPGSSPSGMCGRAQHASPDPQIPGTDRVPSLVPVPRSPARAEESPNVTPVPGCPCPRRFYHPTASSPEQPGGDREELPTPSSQGETEARMKQATRPNKRKAMAWGVRLLP